MTLTESKPPQPAGAYSQYGNDNDEETATSDSVTQSPTLTADSPAQPTPTTRHASPIPASAKRAFLSPEELDRAKDLVLDLLGWGVHPEYLIDCGVSSHAIYRIFTDLRLRLPTNIVL